MMIAEYDNPSGIITTPLITICQNELTPIITRPSDRMPLSPDSGLT
jgi:hypothetical protein